MNTIQNVNSLEKLRAKYKQGSLVCTILIVMFGIAMLVGMSNADVPVQFFVIVIPFIAIPVFGRLRGISKKFQFLYKESFVKSILNETFTDAWCNWNEGYSKRAVEEIGLIEKGNQFHSEDYVSGKYEGIPFEQSDVVVKRVVRSGKSTHTYIHFKGRIFSFEFPKTDFYSVAVFSKSFMYPGNFDGVPHQRVELESEDFNREFVVKAMQPHDAFYVLTPQVMECITSLYRIYGNVAMRYVGGKVHVAINMQGNAFDGDIRKKIVYVEEMDKIKRDCHVIIDVIHKLKL